MTINYCPAAYDDPDRATWRCNLLPGHVGPHDDGIGDVWGDPGPNRLEVAAVCLLGSYAAWDELRPALEKAVGVDPAGDAIQAIHGVLLRWAGREVAP